MRWLGLALATWTAIAIAAILLIGSPLQTPTCARLISPPASCASEIAAQNTVVWETHTLPLLMFVAVGYGAILVIGVIRARRRPPVSSDTPVH